MKKLEKLVIVDNFKDATSLQEAAIARIAVKGRPLEILEAGCGRSWPFRLEGTEFRLTGIDLDADALKHRLEVQRDLHQFIVGDLRRVVIADERFDVVYCSFVLEHIREAHQVLTRFTRWLKPGGSIIIKVPDPLSAHGFLTRVTPHWFHIFYYRHIVGYKEAGLPGHGPYRTYYDRVVSRTGLHEFCKAQGLSIEVEVGLSDTAKYGPWKDRILRIARRLTDVVSGGTLASRHSNLLFVIAKPAATQSRAAGAEGLR